MPTSQIQREEGWVSVTEILEYFCEPELVSWKMDTGRKEAGRISRLAAKTGTRVHELVQADWKGGYKLKAADNSEVRSCMEAWERFKKDYKPLIICMEEEVKGSSILGHFDMIASVAGQECLIDIKTAGSIKPRHWLQLYGYHALHGKPPEVVAILRLDRNIGVYEFEKQAPQKEVFWSLVRVYDFYHNSPYRAEGIANGTDSIKDSPSDK